MLKRLMQIVILTMLISYCLVTIAWKSSIGPRNNVMVHVSCISVRHTPCTA